MILMKIFGGVYNSGSLGPIQLTNQDLKNQNYHQGLMLLNQMDWVEKGQSILICLNTTFNRLLRLNFSKEVESLMELCLGLYYSPNKPIPDQV